MSGVSIWWFIGIVGLIVLVIVGRWFWQFGQAVQVERARELFRLQHERFAEVLLKAASASGKPRGLRWLSCAITSDALLVRETTTHEIMAFVPVQLMFEPIEGSDMEDVPAAREPRPATALFTFAQGHWHTAGRVLFNHSPEQAFAAFGRQFTRVDPP